MMHLPIIGFHFTSISSRIGFYYVYATVIKEQFVGFNFMRSYDVFNLCSRRRIKTTVYHATELMALGMRCVLPENVMDLFKNI
jgi:hypothetical protein